MAVLGFFDIRLAVCHERNVRGGVSGPYFSRSVIPFDRI